MKPQTLVAYFITFQGKEYWVKLRRDAGMDVADVCEAGSHDVRSVPIECSTTSSVVVAGKVFNLAAVKSSLVSERPSVELCMRSGLGPVAHAVSLQSERDRKTGLALTSASKGSGRVKSPMPGRIVQVFVTVGQAVAKGTPLLVVEAMKMENQIVAEQSGEVKAIHVTAGATVEANATLLEVDLR